MVDDDGNVLVMAAVAQLVDPDGAQSVECVARAKPRDPRVR
jgi:hypothetical protein